MTATLGEGAVRPEGWLDRARSTELSFGDLSRRDLAVLAAVAVFPVAAAPIVYEGGFLVRAVLGLALAGIGFPALVALLRARDRAAMWATAFIAAVALSAALSRHPWVSAYGTLHGFATGQLYVVMVLCWAAARTMTSDGRRWITPAALCGAVVTVALLWAQHVGLDLDWVTPEPVSRPGALLGNPVHAGAFLGACLALATCSFAGAGSRQRAALAAATVGVLWSGVQITGGRIAMAGALIGIAWAARRAGWRRALLLGAVVLASASLTSLANPEAETATGRVTAAPGGGFEPRLLTWGNGLDAFAERPLVGWGPGRYGEATTFRTPLEMVEAERPGAYFADAHNLLVELLTTTGALGTLAGVGFLLAVARSARGPGAIAGVVFGLNLLLEPIGPLAVWALLLVGAAQPMPKAATSRFPGVVPRRAAATVGLLAAVHLLLVGVLLWRGFGSGSYDTARIASRLLPPTADGAIAEYKTLRQAFPSGKAAQAVWFDRLDDASARAVSEDPNNMESLGLRSEALVLLGRHEEAREVLEREARLFPITPLVFSRLKAVNEHLGDDAGATEAKARLCRLVDPC